MNQHSKFLEACKDEHDTAPPRYSWDAPDDYHIWDEDANRCSNIGALIVCGLVGAFCIGCGLIVMAVR